MKTKAERKQEILKAVSSCDREKYYKHEVLSEMLKLESEIVETVFSEDHHETAQLKLRDVERHLDQLNEASGGIANAELEQFLADSKKVSNLIRAEISGNCGEDKAFKSLSRITGNYKLLKNVELSDGQTRTELDGTVITPKGVFIIEVKNTRKDIFIAEDGKYYRTGKYLRLDSNLGEKMELRRQLLTKVLRDAGIKNIAVNNLIVFTNDTVEITNECKTLKTTFLCQLPHMINDYDGPLMYSDSEVTQIAEIIESARSPEMYPLGFDAWKFKQDFVSVILKLEYASSTRVELETVEQELLRTPRNAKVKNDKWDKAIWTAVGAACALCGVSTAKLLVKAFG